MRFIEPRTQQKCHYPLARTHKLKHFVLFATWKRSSSIGLQSYWWTSAPIVASKITSVVKFSESQFAFDKTNSILLSSPKRFRCQSWEPPIGDKDEGLQTVDMTDYINQTMYDKCNNAFQKFKATSKWDSYAEPLIYSTVIKPFNNAGWQRLKKEFREKDAIMEIKDPDAFALQ